jgi:hypothetical protein
MHLADKQAVNYLPFVYTEHIEMILADKFMRDTWNGVWAFTEK